MTGRPLRIWNSALVGAVALATTAVQAAGPQSSVPPLPTRIPTTKALSVRPAASPSRGIRFADDRQPEVQPIEEGLPELAMGESCSRGGCNGAPCAPYLRNRPEGCESDRIKMYNRMHEPNWYRYYRCCHYGYHPTQWQAWPEGWLTCRHPEPGSHPYDYHPPKPDSKQLDRERRIRRDLPDRDPPDPLDDSDKNGDPPKPLPPENTTPPPADPPSTVPMPPAELPMP